VCGINGILNFSSKPHPDVVRKMNKVLAHRGPDNDGIYSDESIALGHRRLSIIDLSESANQPFSSEDKRYVMVYNGELYNYQDIKKELADFNFKTNSDTEVILNAYIKFGTACLNLFNGMYAFAIWDAYKKELFAARDRMGVKPFYYSQINQTFVFSSEIRPIVKSGLISNKLDLNSLGQYLQFQTVYAPDTILNGVKILPPASYILITEQTYQINKYWNINEFVTSNSKLNYKDVKEHTLDLLKQSVKRRLIADVPFGAFLSGGIDSSAIVALMSKVSDSEINTFSITFNEEDYTEEKYSRLVSAKYNTKHTEIKLSVNDFKTLLPEALQKLDHPSGDGPNTYVVSKYTKEAGITMALSGIGGDELFGGYPVFNRLPQILKRMHWGLVPLPVRIVIARFLQINKSTAFQKIGWLLKEKNWNFSSLYHLNRMIYDSELVNNMLSYKKDFVLPDLNPYYFKNSIMSSISLAEYHTYLQNVLLRDADQMSMAHALEVREPFMDHKLIEYVLGIPDCFKKGIYSKQLLIDALGDLLPEEVYNRPKMGFTFPWKTWLQNDLKSFCEERINSLAKRSYFNEEVTVLWNRFLNNDKEINWSRIWLLVVLEDWMQNNEIE
jgi:asparagine synthase (glutamine-hydrolysing)